MRLTTLFVLTMVCLPGCWTSATKAITVSSESDYEFGVAAFEKKDYAKASHHFDLALRAGGLNADLAGDALLNRTRASIETRQFAEARRDLEDLDRSPVSPNEVLEIRAYLHFKEGDVAEARRLYLEAQKLNPQISIPAELK